MKLMKEINESSMIGHLFDVATHFKEYGVSASLLANATLLALVVAGSKAASWLKGHIIADPETDKQLNKQEIMMEINWLMAKVPHEVKKELYDILQQMMVAIEDGDEITFKRLMYRVGQIVRENNINLEDDE